MSLILKEYFRNRTRTQNLSLLKYFHLYLKEFPGITISCQYSGALKYLFIVSVPSKWLWITFIIIKSLLCISSNFLVKCMIGATNLRVMFLSIHTVLLDSPIFSFMFYALCCRSLTEAALSTLPLAVESLYFVAVCEIGVLSFKTQ